MCSECRYSELVSGDDYKCKIRSPSVVVILDKATTVFPDVKGTDEPCGEKRVKSNSVAVN